MRTATTAWIVAVLLVACSATSGLTTEYLDQRTGVTVTSNTTPLLLYRDNSSVAAYARNYVHLGPIEVNRSGTYQYFLWVGVWNTMEAASADNHRDGFDSITIYADGEPLSLELAGWTPDAIGASRPTYLKPVASAADAYYRVTVDQIRLIGEASDVRLRTADASPKEYQLWDEQQAARQGFQAFLKAAFF